MKRVLRSFAVGLLVGGLVGLWCGMNIGKEQPLLSNPFADVTLGQQADRAVRDAYAGASRTTEDVGGAVRDLGNQLRDAATGEGAR